MKRVNVRLSTYTADVSGVCSALYELGGMTVIHDPSGCNSTYNTHDEPRWYDRDSLVFISGLSQMDAVMGNDQKLIDDIIHAASYLKPAFISLVRTPVPLMTGTDFEGIAREISAKTGIPAFAFPTTGMESYISGVDMALTAVAEHLVKCPEEAAAALKESAAESVKAVAGPEKDAAAVVKKPGKKYINLLGVTPLDFSVNSTLSSMRRFFAEKGYEVLTAMCMDMKDKDLEKVPYADLNLVVSSAGVGAAKVLYSRFGTAWLAGVPVGAGREELIERMNTCLEQGRKPSPDGCLNGSLDSCLDDCPDGCPEDADGKMRTKEARDRVIIGEPVISASVARAMELSRGIRPSVICPFSIPHRIPGINCDILESEEELRDRLAGMTEVTADPIYRAVCPDGADFISLPHEAFSGRIYRRQIPDLLYFADRGNDRSI